MKVEVEAYLKELEVKGYAPATLEIRRQSLEEVMGYLNQEVKIWNWTQVRQRELEAWVKWMEEAERGPAGKLKRGTIRLWVQTVRQFFGWLHRTGKAVTNEAQEVAIPAAEGGGREVLSEAEVGWLLAQPDVTTVLGVRDRAVLEMLYGTGMRRGEVVGLRVADVEVTQRQVRIRRGKGGGERMVPMTECAAGWVGRYLKEARPELARGLRKPYPKATTGALWLTAEGRAMHQATVMELIKDCGRRAGVNATCHSLRHACATHLLRHGAGIEDIQRLLGHRQVSTTQGYTHLGELAVELRGVVGKLDW